MTAKPENAKDLAVIEQIRAEKTFHYIVQNLESTFGEPKLSPKSDALAMLIEIILSQATSDANSRRTFQNLRKQFKKWENVLAADESAIAEAIRLGGLANQKAKVIKDLLSQLKEKRGKFRLFR